MQAAVASPKDQTRPPATTMAHALVKRDTKDANVMNVMLAFSKRTKNAVVRLETL